MMNLEKIYKTYNDDTDIKRNKDIMKQWLEERYPIPYAGNKKKMFYPAEDTQYEILFSEDSVSGRERLPYYRMFGTDGSLVGISRGKMKCFKKTQRDDGRHGYYKIPTIVGKFEQFTAGTLACCIFPDKVHWPCDDGFTKQLFNAYGIEAFKRKWLHGHHRKSDSKPLVDHVDNFEVLLGITHVPLLSQCHNIKSFKKYWEMFLKLRNACENEYGGSFPDDKIGYLTSGQLLNKEGTVQDTVGPKDFQILDVDQEQKNDFTKELNRFFAEAFLLIPSTEGKGGFGER